MEMTDNMREYLRQRFYRNNHSKYRKYFEEWLSGVVDTQLMYFEKENPLGIIHIEANGGAKIAGGYDALLMPCQIRE